MTDCDIAVIGGGPAGATCAMLLAELGFPVVLFEKGEGKRQHVGESLPSSIRVVFDALALELPPDVLVDRPPAHLVYWGEMQGPSAASPQGESSFLVWRGAFDEMLRRAAMERGVRLITKPVLGCSRHAERQEITYGAQRKLSCRFVVDASGRAGLVARHYRRREKAFRTLALTAHFRTEEADPPTVVESFPDGWVWSAPVRDGLRDVTILLDARTRFERALAQTKHVRTLVGFAPRVGPTRGIDATPYSASRFCDRDRILVGDAGSFLDPLAAHGMHKAMDGALVAAFVVRTVLERPEATEDAMAFFDEREVNIYEVTRERLAGLYRRETRFQDRLFWRKRAGAPRRVPAGEPRAPLRPEMKLASGPGVELVNAPVLLDGYIERREVLRAPGEARAVRFLGTVCLPETFRLAVAAESAAAAARAAPMPFDRAYGAIDWMYRSGYLIEWRASK